MAFSSALKVMEKCQNTLEMLLFNVCSTQINSVIPKFTKQLKNLRV